MVNNTHPGSRREAADLPLSTVIDLFIASKQVEGRSQKTLTWYRSFLTQFVDFCSDGTKCLSVRDLTVTHGRQFIAQLQSRTVRYENHRMRPTTDGGLSPHTIHAYVRVLKVFSGWLHEEGYTTDNVFKRLKRPKLPQQIIEILSDEEIRQIVKVINPNSFLGARLYAMVLLGSLGFCGVPPICRGMVYSGYPG